MSFRTSRRLLTALAMAAGLTVVADPAPGVVDAQGVTPISAVQGAGATSPMVGQTVEVEAVVTSLFTRLDVLDGFFVQEEVPSDSDPNTSEGLFVFCRGFCPAALSVGDLVRVVGLVSETFDTTQITVNALASTTVVSSGNPLPVAVPVPLPASASTRAVGTFENIEAMRIVIPTQLRVAEFFELARFGQIVLTAGDRPFTYTHVAAPSQAGLAAFLAELNTRRIFLDDDNGDQNDAVTGANSNEPYPYPTPAYPTGGLSLTNRMRAGDTITDLTGVMHWSNSAWRVRPIQGQAYTFASANPAPAAPDPVGGRLRVSAFNVLNYFTTIDTTASTSAGPCGPSGTLDCRGADSPAELQRQRTKLIASMSTIDADVAGLIEIQNDSGQSTQDIVTALNATGTGTYASIDTGTIGTDAIKVALIYQPATVTPVGPFKILDQSIDPTFIDTRSRPALVQTFEENATGERFTVAVNHFKSKGSACTPDDPDLNNGAGNCNVTRTNAAKALARFLATDPTGSGDPDFLIMGDLNSYRMEEPITALKSAGYVDLIEKFLGPAGYSYLFDGQIGYLDHALATPLLAAQVTGATEWHINADEVPLFDYNDEVLDVPGEADFERESSALPLYSPTPIRSSDHDPVVIGLSLDDPNAPALVTLQPSRLFDTRPTEAQGTIPVVKQKYGGDAKILRVKVTGVSGIPTTGVEAVALNVTAVDPDGDGFVTVWPCGVRPVAANINYIESEIVPNLVIAPVSPAGEVCFYSYVDTHLVADVSGWLPTDSGYESLQPTRLADTRPEYPQGAIFVNKQKYGGDARILQLKVTGTGGVPLSGVGAVSLNVTAVDPVGPGFVTVYPCGTRPVAANINYVTGDIEPNAVLAPVSADGTICLYSYVDAHLVVDINGWFADSSTHHAVTPARLVDTRPEYPQGAVQVSKQRYGDDRILRVKVTGAVGVPNTHVVAVSLNVTVVDPVGPGFLTAFPCGTRPLTANVNYSAEEIVGNAVIAPVSSSGEVCFFSLVETDIVIDVNGWFRAA